MRATIFYAPGDVRVEKVSDPAIKEPSDALVRVTHACICGSDLWFYRGLTPFEPGWRTGHEWMGVVEEVGATDQVMSSGDETIGRVLEMTRGGARAVLECVGTSDSLNTAIGICRPGGRVGHVGVPHHDAAMDFRRMFYQNIALQRGVAPVRAYIPELMPDVLAGRLDPSPVLDHSVDLAGVPEGYRAMDTRQAIKVMVMV